LQLEDILANGKKMPFIAQLEMGSGATRGLSVEYSPTGAVMPLFSGEKAGYRVLIQQGRNVTIAVNGHQAVVPLCSLPGNDKSQMAVLLRESETDITYGVAGKAVTCRSWWTEPLANYTTQK
jgi:hypothetical protein